MFPVLYDFLDQCSSLRFFRQIFQTEHNGPSGFVPQHHVPGGFIEIGFQAAVPDTGPLCKQIGKHLDHQILGFVNVAEVSVNI